MLASPCAQVETWAVSSVPADLSDVTYNPDTGTFFVVANGGALHLDP
jgi:uncharacterized protein YjiK